MALHPTGLLPAEDNVRSIARALYATVKDAPIISPHGHTDPAWYATDAAFPDPPRSSSSRTITSSACSIRRACRWRRWASPRIDGGPVEQDPRAIWRRFAATGIFSAARRRAYGSSRRWRMSSASRRGWTPANADALYDRIAAALETPALRPRALFERFGIKAISTTDGALDDLAHHKAIRDSGWKGRVLPCYRPDAVVDPEFEGFAANLAALGALTGEDNDELVRLPRRPPQAPRLLQASWARRRRTTATPRRAPPTSTAPPRSACSRRSRRARPHPRRPISSAARCSRTGEDEPGRRARDADPSRLLPQPQRGSLPPLRPRQGADIPTRTDYLCATCGPCSTPWERNRT